MPLPRSQRWVHTVLLCFNVLQAAATGKPLSTPLEIPLLPAAVPSCCEAAVSCQRPAITCCSGNSMSALQYWEEHAALSGSVLVFNTGRSLGQIRSLLTEKQGKLAIPDALITAVGTKAR